jgi:hypothetical protein
LRNRVPSRATRSICRVLMNGWPAARISSQRMSSTSTMTMLGRRVLPGEGHAVETSAAPIANRKEHASRVARGCVLSRNRVRLSLRRPPRRVRFR